MKYGMFKPAMAVLAAGISLSGCVLFDDTRRSGPDEFGVVSRAPLSQPPDYSLRPPRAGAKRPNEVTPRDDAKKKLLSESSPPPANPGATSQVPTLLVPTLTVPSLAGAPGDNASARVPAVDAPTVAVAQPADTMSSGELALLQQAGAHQTDSKIRTLVDRESGRVREEDSLVDKLVFWRSVKSQGATIDPSGEAERLNRNAALGRPLSGNPKPANGK